MSDDGATDGTASVDADATLHRDHPVETAGAPTQAATAAMVLLHGRGSTAQFTLRLVDEFYHRGVLYLAPQATDRSWYPWSGDRPLADNEPWLSAALRRVDDALATAAEAGVAPDRTVLYGFSQGASVAAEYVARNPRRYGGLVALSGTLPGESVERTSERSLDGTPVFFGCGSDDDTVPAERVRASARTFEALGGDVTCRLYDGLGHAITTDELLRIDAMVGAVADDGSA
jgi:phospholipase/carboxylesterase